MGHGAWGMGHGAWGMGHGAWGMGHGDFKEGPRERGKGEGKNISSFFTFPLYPLPFPPLKNAQCPLPNYPLPKYRINIDSN
jgi:hypothetical protein